MEAIEKLIKMQEYELTVFWKHRSQSNPSEHFEFREMRKELDDLIKRRDDLKKIATAKQNQDNT